MSYAVNSPTYEAIQWDGANVGECEAFFTAWFPQSPPPPPPPAWQPPPPFVHDPEAQTITISPGHTLQLGDWMVNGGTWGPYSTWAGQPEVTTDQIFQVKYAQSGP